MENYDVVARYYDAVEDDAAGRAAFMRSLIERHHPAARTLLELGCGTGLLLEQFQPDFEVTGLDLSERMLAFAAEKVPDARLLHGDMSLLDLGERFDVVICGDTTQHLLEFEEWETLFDRASEHLDDEGVFILVVTTEREFAALVEYSPWAHWTDDGDLLLMSQTDDGDGAMTWSIRIFEHLGDSDYRLHSEDMRVVSFPTDRIKASLSARFRSVRVYDARRPRPTPASDCLHFVCRK